MPIDPEGECRERTGCRWNLQPWNARETPEFPAMILTLTLNPAIDLALGTKRISVSERTFVTHETETAGGKGINAARAIQLYGGKSLAVAPVGGRNEQRFRELLRADRVPAQLVPVEGATRRNIAITDELGKTVKLDHPGAPLSRRDLTSIEKEVAQRLPTLDWLMLSGSMPPSTPVDIYPRLVEQATRTGVPVLVDTSGPALVASLPAQPAIVKPNLAEAEELLQRPIRTLDDTLRAAGDIRQRGAQRVILSLGANGAVGTWENGALHVRSPNPATGSAVGAGDVLAGVCVWALARGDSFAEALRWGVAAASVAASLPGSEFGSIGAAERLRRTLEVHEC